MKKLLLALAFIFGSTVFTSAQQATTCPTRPQSDDSNACATTSFVHQIVSAFLPIADLGANVLTALEYDLNSIGGLISNPGNGPGLFSLDHNSTPYTDKSVIYASQYGAKCDDATNDSAALQNALNAIITTGGGTLILPPGKCLVPSGLTADYSSYSSAYKPVVSITGQGQAVTQLIVNGLAGPALNIIGNSTNDESNITLRGFSILGNATSGSIGLQTNHTAFLHIYDFAADGFTTGWSATNLEQSDVHDQSQFRFNTNGVILNGASGSGATGSNSLSFYDVAIGSNSNTGLTVKDFAAVNFYTGSIQYNGQVGVSGTYGALFEDTAGGSFCGYNTVGFYGTVFEGDAGDYALGMNVSYCPGATLTVSGGSFLRVGSADEPPAGYPTNDIAMLGTEPVNLILSGTTFISTSDYTPSGGRPNINIENSDTLIYDNGSNYFQNTTEGPNYTGSNVGGYYQGQDGNSNGQVAIANGSPLGATMFIKNLSATTGYNFNLPATAGSSGNCLASGGGGTNSMTWASCSGSGANPSATAGPSAINGSATTFMRSDAAPAVQVGTAAQEGILEVGTNLTVTGGTVSSPTATSSTLGSSSPDNATLKATNGVYAVQYPTSGDLMLSAGNGAVPTAYAGSSCSSNILTALSAAGVGTCTTLGTGVFTALGDGVNTNGGLPTTSTAAIAAGAIKLGAGSGTAETGLADVAAGELLTSGGSGSNPAYSATPTLGASGTLGSLTFGNATSGTVTLETVTGTLGSVTASLPANTGTISETNLAETISAVKTFGAGDIVLSGAVNGDIATFNSSSAVQDSGTLLSSLATSGANTNITSLDGLTTPLSVAQGGTGDTGTAWSSYSPSVTCSSGSPTTATATARYKTLGKTVWESWEIAISNDTGCSGANIVIPAPGGVTIASSLIEYTGSGQDGNSGTLLGAGAINGTGLVISVGTVANHTYYGSVIYESQ